MKNVTKKALSCLLAAVMLLGMLPAFSIEADASSINTNLAGGFEGQDADVFTALGFDTTEIPEGYDVETTDNPYGRDKLPGNQVFELVTASSHGTIIYGKDNNNVRPSDIYGIIGRGPSIPLEMYAVAAGDFDGDGLAGEAVYVGYPSVPNGASPQTAQSVQLSIYDGKTNTYSSTKEVGKASPYYTSSANTSVAQTDAAWQNLLQVAAGDFDGDGTSEIAVYVPEDGKARVDVYKYQKTSQSGADDWKDLANWERVWSHALSSTKNAVPNMVSLAAGDFNRDGVDDLAISSGSVLSDMYAILSVTASTASVLWGSRSHMLQSVSPLDLNESELGKQARVSLFAGDLNGDGVAELIATGQPVNDLVGYRFYYSAGSQQLNTKRTAITYLYDPDGGLIIEHSSLLEPVVGEFVTTNNPNYGQEGEPETIEAWQSGNGFDQYYYSAPMMRTNAAVVHTQGAEYTSLYLDSCLYEWIEGSTLQLSAALDEKITSDGASVGGNDWGLEYQHAIHINTRVDSPYAEYGAASADIHGQGFDILGTSLYRNDSWRDGTSGKHFTGYSILYGDDNGTLTIKHTQDDLGLGADGNRVDYSATFNGTALVMLDVDIDTVLIEYAGIHYLTYSDPKVLAIIAAAPYFEDVDKVSDYDYAWQNTTSYSRIQGEGESDIVSVDLEAGFYFSGENVVGGGKIEYEAGGAFTLEWEKETTRSTEYTLTFETSQDEDAVAFFSIPTENYVYNIYTPDGKGGYTRTVDVISNTFTPCYQVLTLDYYESIQGNYDELPSIKGTALTSTPGDPSSYPGSASGYDVIAQWNDDPAGVSFGNGAISQEITITEEESETYNMGAAVSFKFGGGLGSQSDVGQIEVHYTGGGQFALNPAGGWSNINLTGTTFSGTVTNMPLDFRDYGYYYSWKLFAYNYTFDDGTSIPVVSYLVGDVSEPPQLPEDFQQDYDRTTSDKNVLTWTYDGAFQEFYIYKYFDFPVGGGLQKIATIGSDTTQYTVKYDEDGKPYREYYFEDTGGDEATNGAGNGLAPYTEYQYAIQVQRLSPVPPLSSPSGLLTARTKASVGYPQLAIAESDGDNNGQLLVYPDKNEYLTVAVTGPEGQTIANYYSTVQYQWQKLVRGAWTDMAGERALTLTFANAGVDTAGTYRCRVNVLTKADNTAITAYTNAVTLTHAKRPSYVGELAVNDAPGGGIELYAKVYNAHSATSTGSGSIPSGTVTFNLVNNATGDFFQHFIELDAAGVASRTLEASLPEGMYTVTGYYSGSFIFKPSSAETLYLSERGAGYDIDAPVSLVYGDEGEAIFRRVDKTGGVTEATAVDPETATLLAVDVLSYAVIQGATALTTPTVENGNEYTVGKGNSYYFSDGGLNYYFTASRNGTVKLEDDYAVYTKDNNAALQASYYLKKTNETGVYTLEAGLPAGAYAIKMQAQDAAAVYTTLTVALRPVTLQLPHKTVGEKLDTVPPPTFGQLEVVAGSWAPCDFDGNGELEYAGDEATVTYTNTAGASFNADNVADLCGYYTMRSNMPMHNHNVTYLDGSLTVIGATRDVKIGVREFAGLPVGTLYAVSPEYGYTREKIGWAGTPSQDGVESAAAALTQQHATGTRLVFTAVPDEGYEVYDWYINGVAQNNKSTSIAYVLLAEDTSVEVQFDVKKNALVFGATGDEGGGAIACSDESLTSGSVVLANALFTFTATANEGYHFKEWRYTQQGAGTQYFTADEGEMSSSFDLVMPNTSCSLYAVFERDFYTLTYEDLSGNAGLTAWYASPEDGSRVEVASGTAVKGDTVITVEPAAGCTKAEGRRYVSTGSQGADEGAGYVFAIDRPTHVTGWTTRGSYDVTLAFNVEGTMSAPAGAELAYTIGGEEQSFLYDTTTFEDTGVQTTTSTKIEKVPGGTPVSAQIVYPGYYDLVGWVTADTKTTAKPGSDDSITDAIKKTATAVVTGDSVVAGAHYRYDIPATGGNVTHYFTAPVTGTVGLAGAAVTVYASGDLWSIAALSKDETITVYLKEKAVREIEMTNIDGKGAYSYELPEGATQVKKSGAAVGGTIRDTYTVRLHHGDTLTVTVTPAQGWTVTYWQMTPESGTPLRTRATALRYSIPSITADYTFEPIFAATTYNTISWPSISASQNNLTLSPLEGFLSSVASGDDFEFMLTGGTAALIDKVYANGNEFTAGGHKVDETTYSVITNGDQHVYKIDNVYENQVITVTLKKIGVEVNGVDVSALSGSGWSYDTTNQLLTLSRPRLTLSGANRPTGEDSLAPNLRIVMTEAATNVTLNGLTLTGTKAVDLFTTGAESTVVTVIGENSFFLQDRENGTSSSIVTATLHALGDLTLRGTGTLSLRTEQTGNNRLGRGLYTNGDLTVTGDVTLVVTSKNTGNRSHSEGILVSGDLTVGAADGKVSPTVRVVQEDTSGTMGIEATRIDMYSGELNVQSSLWALLACEVNNYGGIMELSATNPANSGLVVGIKEYGGDANVTREWRAYYTNGYMLRMAASRSSVPTTSTKTASYYSNQTDGYDVLGKLDDTYSWLVAGLAEAKYIRLAPLDDGSNGSNVTLSVQRAEGETRSIMSEAIATTASNDDPLFYYIDPTPVPVPNVGDLYLIETIRKSELIAPGKYSADPNFEIIAVQDGGGLTLQPYDYTFIEAGDGAEGGPTQSTISLLQPSNSTQYDYTLSGISSTENPAPHVNAATASVASLTLNGLTATSLAVSDAPVYLVGDNFLLSGSTQAALALGVETPAVPAVLNENTGEVITPAQPAVYYNTINLWSKDGTGTLTLSATGDSAGDSTVPALSTLRGNDAAGNRNQPGGVNLHNVKALTLIRDGATNAQAALTAGATVQYFDKLMSGKEAYLGQAWKLDSGNNAVSAQTHPAQDKMFLNEDSYPYMKFYAATTDAAADPSSVTHDKGGDDAKAFTLTAPAIAGQIHSFDRPATDETKEKTGYVALLNSAGSLIREWTTDGGDKADYGWAPTEQKLTVNASALNDLDIGEYIIRVYFYDEDIADADYYTLDIPLTITDTAVSNGLTIHWPDTVLGEGTVDRPLLLARDTQVPLTTTFTGTTPTTYAWFVTWPTGTVQDTNERGSAYSPHIGVSATIGNVLQYTVRSYSGPFEAGNKLGEANVYIEIVPTATDIAVSGKGLLASGDGSYTLYHNKAGQTWDFDATVTLDGGDPLKKVYDEPQEGNPDNKLTWSLWGAQLTGTDVDKQTGELTVATNETGTGGVLQLTASYKNEDGSTTQKVTLIRLSTDAHVSWDDTVAANGAIAGAVYGVSQTSIPADGLWVPANNPVTVTATPAEGYIVRTWYVNGVSVMENPLYTVDAENHTLQFTTATMRQYAIAADYVNASSHVIQYEAGENGAINATSDGQPFASGASVVKGGAVTFTATPDAHCTVARWLVDGAVYEKTPGTAYTGTTLELTDIQADHTVRVEFVGAPLTIHYMAAPTTVNSVAGAPQGSLTLFVNGEKVEVTPVTNEGDKSVSYTATVHAMDDVLVVAVPNQGFVVEQWSARTNGSYGPIAGSEGLTTYSVAGITEAFDVKVDFKPIPKHEVTVAVNTYQNGAGTVRYGLLAGDVIDVGGTHTIEVTQHDNLTLLALPDPGCYAYEWYVPEGVEYSVDETGNVLTLMDVTADLNDIASGRYVGVTLRRSFYDVTLSYDGSGSLSATYDPPEIFGAGEQFTGKFSIPGGSALVLEADPMVGYILSSLTVNGEEVTATWDNVRGYYSYTIDPVTAHITAQAVFTAAGDLYPVTGPGSFTDETSGTPTPAGTVVVDFVPDGVSGDSAQDETVEVAPGGTATLTFAPASGYLVDANILLETLNSLIPETSEAEVSLRLAANSTYMAMIRNVDMALDFSSMANPFVAYSGGLHTVSWTATGDGTLTVRYGEAVVNSGAKLPANAELSITAQPEPHNTAELTVDVGTLVDDVSDDPLPEGALRKTLTVVGNTQITATFTVKEHKVTVNIHGEGGGVVTINGEPYAAGDHYFDEGGALTISAEADSNSELILLGVTGATANQDGSYTVGQLNSDIVVTAAFDPVACVVTYAVTGNGTLTVRDDQGELVASGDTVPVGTLLTILPVPDAHNRLQSLTAGGTAHNPTTSYRVNAAKQNHIVCSFEVAEVPVSWTAVNGTLSVTTMPDGDPVANGQYVPVGSQLAFVATPAGDSYTLETLTVNGATRNASGWYVVGTQPVTAEAVFQYTGGVIIVPDPIPGPPGPVGPTGPSGGISSDSEYTVAISWEGEGTLRVTADGETVENGASVALGTILHITAEPAEGQALRSLTVNGHAFQNGGAYEVYANTDIAAVFGAAEEGYPYWLNAAGERLFIGLCYDLNGDGLFTQDEYIAPEGVEVLFAPNSPAFTDIAGHWGEAYIRFVADREIFNGVAEGLFDPNGKVTRAMLTTVLGRIYERSYGEIENDSLLHSFGDCDYAAYYGKYIEWADANGIVEGFEDQTFRPDDLVTREQLAVMLFRFARLLGQAPETLDSELGYADSGLVADWAREGLLYCQTTGLIEGVGEGSFAPKDTATRAQVAAILQRFIASMFE